ncbi:hypothetical protein [Streptomyces sp. NPDC051001]|uniref:hypothetical protein n=1 Tax=Streptomyces sp. NPDC051001 TaxID=3155795 RepID=UPI003433E224
MTTQILGAEMDTSAIVSALIGAVAALAGGVLSYYLVARGDRNDEVAAEAAALQTLAMELDVAIRMAKEQTATPLPTYMLWAVMPSINRMAGDQRKAFIDYSEKVLRYNGRVHRLVAFGTAKRIRGEDPGAEKPGKEHSDPVLLAGAKASRVLFDHLLASRFRGHIQTGPAVGPRPPGASPPA